MTYYVNMSSAGCCGAVEICEFDSDDSGGWPCGDYEGNTFQELLNNVLIDNKGYVLSIYFVKYKNHLGKFDRNYEWEGLRKLVRNIKGVTEIPAHINPNSGNKIVGYVWLNK